MNYYIQIDSNNYIIGTISTSQTLAAPWISIHSTSLATAQTPGATYTNGTVNPPAANYNVNIAQTKQIALVYGQLQTALVSPYSFTTSGGVTASMPMDGISQSNYHNAYTAYVSAGLALPSGFFFFDVTGNEVSFTTADIKNLYEALVTRGQGYYAAFSKAKTDINAATTVSAVQAIMLVNP